MTAPPTGVRFRQAFYAAVRQGSSVDLLLGPFREQGVAESALDAARELSYLADAQTVPADVEVVGIPLVDHVPVPEGRLNDLAVSLAV